MPAVEIIRSIFVPVWRLFTETPVPGLTTDELTVTFADLLIAIILISISFSILSYSLGLSGKDANYRSGSTKNPKISKERKGDQY